MCGLVGGNNPEWHFDDAVSALRHRGPDAQRIQRIGDFTFGFARLAVRDPSQAANQPMMSADGKVCLSFNGEIYDCDTLRTQLQSFGHQFRTLSDTEAVLNAYRQWGAEFVHHVDGMFAIAIYDQHSEQLHLYRDRAGIKPLYYLSDGRDFAFASELKALETLLADGSLQPDKTAFYDFLTYGYIPAPKSMFRNVFKLPPATQLTFDIRKRRIRSQFRYWNLSPESRPVTDISAVSEELRDLMRQAVQEQLVADVPVGCFLSGGVDSSVVVSHAAEVSDHLQTFSVGFDVAEHSETDFARRIAEQFQTQHHETTFAGQSTENQLLQLRFLYDEPFADTSAFPTFAVSHAARQSVTVALSGDGGDELFGGYKWYLRYKRMLRYGATKFKGPDAWLGRLEMRMPQGSLRRETARAASLLCSDPLSLYVEVMGGPSLARRQSFAEVLEIDADYDDCWHYRQHWRPDLPLLTRLQYLDFHTYLPDDILTKVDRASMASSLEVRVPFLSRRLVEFAFSLPERIRYHGGHLKGLLKYAYQGILPDTILHRPKKGFSTPPSHLSTYDGRLRETILAQNYGIQTDANSLPLRLNYPVAQSQWHSGHEHVPGVRKRRA